MILYMLVGLRLSVLRLIRWRRILTLIRNVAVAIGCPFG